MSVSRILKVSGVIQGGIIYGNEVTIDISSNVNNLVIPNLESTVLVRLNVTGNRSLTGIVPISTEVAQEIQIFNVGTGNLSMKNNDAGSSGDNRFLLGANRKVQSNEGVRLIYDPAYNRWRGSGLNI